MMKHSGRVFVSQVLRGEPITFEAAKTLDDHLKKVDRDAIVYEDAHVVAYRQHDADVGSTVGWTEKVAIALKTHVPTLLDLDVGDHHSTAALLRAIQAVALKLELYDKGFEIRSDVLPPLQRKGFLEIKVRAGKRDEQSTVSGRVHDVTEP
ncbi:MAG: hypothetical protein ACLPSH_09945 [Vulcanimicrobiaceae bacterium]